MNDPNQAFLVECEKLFRKGNKWTLMQAIYACASSRTRMPDWVCEAYKKSFEDCRTAKAKSWDDVFGKPWPKGTRHNATYKRQTMMWPIFNMISEMKKEDPKLAIDIALFERVGKLFNIGKTLASEFYYDAKEREKRLLD